MKVSLLIILSFAAISCASQREVAKLPGEWKVDNKKVTTGMPNYPLSEKVFQRSIAQGRKPASLTDQELAQELEKEKPSLRRLYFKALYQQWRVLSKFSQKSTELNSCPQFHHDKVVMDEKQQDLSLVVAGPKPSADQLPFYPEWALKVKSKERFVPVWHTNGGKNLTSALAHHATKIRRELSVMCEDGASDAYFRLENMVTYVVKKPEFQSKNGLQALLKIPVFSTMLLLKSLEGAPAARFAAVEQELLNEVQGFQLQQYIVELRKERQQLYTGSL